MLSYAITFPEAGTYDLYARVRVNAGGANDDSFFYPTTFGTQSATAGNWITANGLFNVGYTGAAQIVDGAGTASTAVWKWVDMSRFTVNGSTPVTFTVGAPNTTLTFQIGAREDGLDFDKFVFGKSGVFFTVNNLDLGQQGSSAPPVTFTPTGTPIAAGKPKYLSSAYSTAQAPYFGVYWDGATPENGGKWGSVENTRGTYNWAEADAAYAQAVAGGGPFRFHTLIWGTQQPTWLTTTNLTDAEKLAAIDAWFQAVATHFQGKRIDFIDVVNEPTHQPPTGTSGADGGGYLTALGGSGTTGWDWIITAFRMARQYFPNSKLMLTSTAWKTSPTGPLLHHHCQLAEGPRPH